MEEQESLHLSESSLNLSSGISDIDTTLKTEDNRILCCNEQSLNNILSTVAQNVKRLAEPLNLGDEFVLRCLEVFKDTIQENVTINGLPYTANENFLSIVTNEDKTNENKCALFHNLSETVQDCAVKRKKAPKEYCRIYSMRLKAERHKLKNAAVYHEENSSRFRRPVLEVDALSKQRLETISKEISSSRIKVHSIASELQEIKKNITFAKSISSQKPYNETLYDTGYNSS